MYGKSAGVNFNFLQGNYLFTSTQPCYILHGHVIHFMGHLLCIFACAMFAFLCTCCDSLKNIYGERTGRIQCHMLIKLCWSYVHSISWLKHIWNQTWSQQWNKKGRHDLISKESQIFVFDKHHILEFANNSVEIYGYPNNSIF